MVEAARIAYRDFPTVVNAIEESGISYANTKVNYAIMDSKMQASQRAIGGSSDLAQLALSYYADRIYKGINDEETQQIYENIITLAVLAQIAIDGCKRVYSVDPTEEIKRIRRQKCMKREKDYPRFMEYTHSIALTKNGINRDPEDIRKEKERLRKRIDKTIICPMNWMEETLDNIKSANYSKTIPTEDIFIWEKGRANSYHVSKLRQLVEEYSNWVKQKSPSLIDDNNEDILMEYYLKNEEIISNIKKVKMSRITMNHLIGSCLGIDNRIPKKYRYQQASKYTRKMLNLLYKADKEMFLSFWKTQEREDS